jgi:hypothetical protein
VPVITTDDIALMLRVEALEEQDRLIWLREHNGSLRGFGRVWERTRPAVIARFRGGITVDNVYSDSPLASLTNIHDNVMDVAHQ